MLRTLQNIDYNLKKIYNQIKRCLYGIAQGRKR